MTIELLISKHISPKEASKHIELIQDIFHKRLGPPKVKPTKNLLFENEPTLRAKLSKGGRLVFKWDKRDGKEILHLLIINEKHNYKKIKRGLDAVNPKPPTLVTIDDEPPAKEKKQPLNLKQETSSELAFLAIDKIIIPDEEQKQALQKLDEPIAFTGPPGAGKTTVLYTLLILNLKKKREAAALLEGEIPVKPAEKIIFFSHSPNLLKKLGDDSKTHQGLPAITFTSWVDLLVKKNPGKQLIAANAFTEWFSAQKCTLGEKDPDVIHYELSLIASFGFENYIKFGERQCYYAMAGLKKKKELNTLLKDWLDHLEKFKLIDPMVNTIPEDQAENYDRACLDEAQNLPPVALKYLIQHTPKEGFTSSHDSEQCLTLAPFIENCLQTLMFSHYGKYSMEHLPRSYRCSAAVAEIASFVMQRKRQLDGKHERRNYPEIKSALDIEGVVSWIDKNDFKKLEDHCKDPETAVLIPDNTPPKEIEQIKKVLNIDYILRYRDAIGLDLKNVILWKPFSQASAFKNLNKNGDGAIPDGLTLAQWKAFNALYMAISRAEEGVYVFEEDPFYKNLGEYILGDKVSKNTVLSAQKLTPEEVTQKLKQAIETHLNQNQIEIARKLMVKLGMSEQEISDKIKPAEAAKNPPVAPCKPVVEQPPVKTTKPTTGNTWNRLSNKPPPVIIPSIKRRNPAINKAMPVKTLPSQTAERMSDINNLPLYNDIYKILASKNTNHLVEIFNSKYLIKMLFELPIGEHNEVAYESLYLKMISTKTWREALIVLTLNFLEELPELREKLSGEFLFTKSVYHPISVFIFLIEDTLGLQLLLNLVANNQKIVHKLNADSLYKPSSEGAFFATPFHVLCQSILGISLFFHLISYKPILAAQLPGKLLCQVLVKNDAGKDYYKSPLLWLLLHDCDLSLLIIERLINSNKSVVQALPDVFCNLLPLAAGDLANTSLLHWFIKTNLPGLMNLYNANPKILQNITAKAFYGRARGFSPFLGLVILGEEGLELLQIVFKLNPKLIQEMTLYDLSIKTIYKSSSRTTPPYSISPLYWLSYQDEYLDILEGILNNNIDLAKEISADVLSQPYGVDLSRGYGRSVLFELTSTTKGLMILSDLFKLSPELLPSLSYGAWIMPMSGNLTPTALVNLCLDPVGLKILDNLLDQNQNFTTKMTRDLFTRSYKTLSGKHRTLFNALNSTPFGQEIVKKLEMLLPPEVNESAKVLPKVGIFKSTEKGQTGVLLGFEVTSETTDFPLVVQPLT